MRSRLAVALACAAIVAVVLAVHAADAPQKAPADGVFIHLSHGSDDPHRVLMALSMAQKMAEDHPVLIYFDIRAIDVVLADAEDLTYAQFTPLKAQLANLGEKGVRLMACPGCLQAAGKTPEDLADGIVVADKAAFFNFTDGRILTLDY